MSDKYYIVRMYMNRPSHRVRGKSNLTLEEAQAHCKDPETSSRTCKKRVGKRRTEQYGQWFDGYESEK